MRTVTATITNRQGIPQERLMLAFLPEVEGHDWIMAFTDASGVVTVDLETDIPYALGLMGGYILDGTPLSSVAVIRLTVPEGEEPVRLLDCATAVLSTEWPALLRRLETVEQGLATLTETVTALHPPDPDPEPEVGDA